MKNLNQIYYNHTNMVNSHTSMVCTSFPFNSHLNFSSSPFSKNLNSLNKTNKLYYSTSLVTTNNNIENKEFISKYKLGNWTYYLFNFNYNNLDLVENNISQVQSEFEPKTNYVLFFQGIYQGVHYISIGPKVLINKDTEAKFLNNYFEHYLDLLGDNQYNIEDISKIIIKIRSTNILEIKQPSMPENYKSFIPSFPNKLISEKYYPASVNPKDFGDLIECTTNNKNQEVYTYEYNNYTIIRTKVSENYFLNEVYSGSLKITEFTDILIYEGPDYSSPYFIREINKKLKIFYAINKKIIFKRELKQNTNKIKKISLSFNQKDFFYSFDIETYRKDEIFHPYACGWYNGEIANTYYLTDFTNADEMITSAIKGIVKDIELKKKLTTTQVVYVHNLAHFDCIYLLKVLNSLGSVKLAEKSGKITYIKFSIKVPYLGKDGKLKERIIKLKFFDSIQLIPASLKRLAAEFGTQTQKGIFPYRFVREGNLNYEGPVPSINYFDEISNQEYNIMLEKGKWNLKDETLKYLNDDIKALHEVILKFANEVFDEFNLNIFEYSTVSSLALAIFRGHYLKDENHIPIISGNMYKFIRDAYYGGITDVYQPRLQQGFIYDVNSLYPYAMTQPMPMGNPIFTDENDLNKLFGFSFAKIETPKNIKFPILPKKDEKGNLICPIGSWSGWYFTEELKEAKKLGYKIEILCSYHFSEKGNPFKDFVEIFYNKKANSSGASRMLYKLILNSLYGRLGLNLDSTISEIISSSEVEKYYLLYEVLDGYSLDENFEFIKYKINTNISNIQNENVLKEATKHMLGLDQKYNESISSVAMAAAITAYARIHMNKFKFIPGNPMFYTDTDSGHYQFPLQDEFIGPELGKMKLENIVKDAFYLAPKLYGYIKENEKPEVKAKGVSNFPYEKLKELYNGFEPINIKKEIWLRDQKVQSIRVETRNILISAKFTKREKVFNAKGQWVDTRPLVVKDGVVVSTENIKRKNNTIEPIYGEYSFNLIEAPNYKLIEAPKILAKGPNQPKGSKLPIGAKNVFEAKNKAHIESLINNLKELDKKMDKYSTEITKYKANEFASKLTKTQLIGVEQSRGAVLRELIKLGVKDPYGYILEIADIIYLPAPLPAVIYLNGPKIIKLLALPAPNYKLLKAPKIINEPSNGGGNKIELPDIIYLEAPQIILQSVIYLGAPSLNLIDKGTLQDRFLILNNKVNDLKYEFRAEKDFNTKNLLFCEFTRELYILKIFVVENWNLIPIPKDIPYFTQINKFGWESELNLISKHIDMYKDDIYNKNETNIFLPEMIKYSKILKNKIENNKINEDSNLNENKKSLIEIENKEKIEILDSNKKQASLEIKKFESKNNKKEKVRIQEIINSIKDTENFQIAMTHKSYCNEKNKLKSYEILEFFGDTLLEYYVTLFIINSFSDYKEGQLTNLRSSFVCGENLANLSTQIELENYLKMEKGLENQFKNNFSKKQRIKILADIFESFVAALYLEKGEDFLHEFLSLTVFNRPETKDKLKEYKLISNKNFKPIENKIDKIVQIQNKNEIEKNLKEIYTYLDIKFQKQEKTLKSLIKDELNIFKNKIPQNPQKDFLEKIIFVIKVIIFILLIFLIILLIIWLLIHLEPFEPNIKIIETTPSEFPSNSGNNEGEKFFKSLFQSDEADKLRFVRISFLLLFSIYKIWKQINISKGNFNENENENLNDFTRLNDVLENYLGENKNMFENESNENIINIVENILNNYESDPQDINNFFTQNSTNSPEANNEENLKLSKSLIISSFILGSSFIISNIIPTLLEIIFK